MNNGYPQLNKKSLCLTCAGCNRLENKTFYGITSCANYIDVCAKIKRSKIGGDTNKSAKEEWEEIISPYWKDD